MRFDLAVEMDAHASLQLFDRDQPVGLGHRALAVHPFRLDRVQPRALRGQEAGDDPHPGSALPHGRTSTRVLERGDLLLIDFGARVGGYCSDLTRTMVLGKADPRQQEVHAVVEEAQHAAREGVRAGMTGREADALARDHIEARGYGEAFGHSLGHGVGLEVHEGPRLAATASGRLPGDAVSAAPVVSSISAASRRRRASAAAIS